MIDWLIRVGRALVVLCAMITIIACAIQGYILANIYYQTTLMEDGTAASGPVFGAVLGAVVGLIIAGAVFGLVAAVFDMQRSLRLLADGLPPVNSPAATLPREPAPPVFTPVSHRGK
jgi:hypothetical protein